MEDTLKEIMAHPLVLGSFKRCNGSEVRGETLTTDCDGGQV